MVDGDLFQHVQAELAEPFPVQQHPVVVPAGEQVVAAGGRALGGGARVTAVADPGRGGDEVVHVEADRRVEADGVTAGDGSGQQGSWRSRHSAVRSEDNARSSGTSGQSRPARWLRVAPGRSPISGDHPLQPPGHHHRVVAVQQSEAAEQVQAYR